MNKSFLAIVRSLFFMSVSFTAPAAEQLSLLPYAVTNQQLQFTVGADTNAYFVLQRSLALPRFDAYAIGLGLTNNLWTHPIIGTNTNAFFRLMTVPVETPVSSLDDGIDDLFKIITIRILIPQHQLVTQRGSLILRADIGKQLSQRHLLKRVDAHNL